MEPSLLVVLAAALLIFGGFSRLAERSIVTPPLFFAALGYVVSSAGLGWLELPVEGAGIHALAELTLVLVLFTDASRIDLDCLRREESLPLRLLALGLPLTIAAGAAAAYGLFPQLGWAGAALLAAILAPTDAALGQSVVSSPRVPIRMRQSLNVASGLNDGIALPVVLFFASLAGATGVTAEAGHWARFVALQLVLGPAVGVAVGVVGGRLVQKGTTAGWINAPFQRLSALGLALLAFAGSELVGGNGFIAAFVAGLALGNAARSVCTCLHEFGEAEGQLLTLLVFFVFGAVMVPAALHHADGAVWLYGLASLTLVRMLPVALACLGSGLRWPSLAFLGWFGPRGLASILFALLVLEGGGLAEGGRIEAIVVVTVLLSTLLHGVTAYPLAARYGAWTERVRESASAEHGPSPELPVRIAHTADAPRS
ncbi:MAG: cation:proton antiporter [Proteobacteria bacterium]|nr:cation:proton antiporter [Pseudomonadota bacterium]